MAARTTDRVNEAFETLIRAGDLGKVMQWVDSLPLEEIPITHRVVIVAQIPSPDGPVPAGSGAASFWGNETIEPLGVKNPNPAQGIISVQNSFSSGSALQADLFQIGIGTTLAGPDERFAVLGNAFTTEPKQGVGYGLSPDNFTKQDLAASAVSKIAPDMLPATYDHGGWAWSGCEDFADGWNMKYTIADRVDLIDDPVSSLASCGIRRTGHGMSSSLIETAPFVQAMNDYYKQLTPGGNPMGTRQFVPVNAERTGLAPNGMGYVSTFKPSRLGDLAKASFGLMSNHPLYTNPCMRTFASPILIKGGTPFNVQFTPKNRPYVQKFLQDIGATFNGSMSGTGFSPSPDPAMLEWDPRRTPPAAQLIDTVGNRVIYKDGWIRWETCFYGFSLIEKALAEALGGMRAQWGAVGLVPIGWD